MQNPIQKLGKSSIVFKKLDILSKKLKTLTNSNYHRQPPTTIELNILYFNSAHVSYLPISARGCSRFFLFCLDLQLLAQTKEDLVCTHSPKSVFIIFANNSRLKQNFKKSGTLFIRNW